MPLSLCASGVGETFLRETPKSHDAISCTYCLQFLPTSVTTFCKSLQVPARGAEDGIDCDIMLSKRFCCINSTTRAYGHILMVMPSCVSSASSNKWSGVGNNKDNPDNLEVS